jgi:amino acid adenylation domain-containing protein
MTAVDDPVLLHHLLDRAARRHPDDPAVSWVGSSMTSAEFAARSRACAAWLHAHGVRRGDRVVVQAANSPAIPVVLNAVSRAGAIFVPISADLRPFQVGGILADAAPALVLVDAERAAVLPPDAAVRSYDLNEAVEGGETGGPEEPGRPDDLALLIYTSGSTSAPKGVMSPHAQILFATAAIAGRLGYRRDDVIFLRLPFSFDYGLYQVMLAAATGACLHIAEAGSNVAVLREICDSGATVVPLVPSLATMLNQLATRRRPDTGAVRLITNTGAKLPPATIAALRRTFPAAAVVLMYGMTECKRITIADPDADASDPLSVGSALPGTEVLVVDPQWRPLPFGDVGQIVVRGPHVMAGYWRAPELTSKRFRPDPATGGTMLLTGDFGSLTPDGLLHFEGRRDDIIKRRGTRVSLLEVEAAAMDVPGVAGAAAVTGGASGDELVLVVSGEVEPAVLSRELAARLDEPRRPDRLLILDALPLGGTGKIDRATLRATVTAELAGEHV